nr:VanZ family protein [uncultured Romboutsia sp.]
MQSITGLGAFDIDDITSNTLGATIGYIVYKKAFSSKLNIKSIVISIVIVIISIIGTMIISELGTQIFEKSQEKLNLFQRLMK